MQALILAGGKGTRLAERLAGKPKPLVTVCGIPLLERQVRTLEANGIDDIVVLVNHAADQIRAFFKERSFAARIRIIDDGEPRGTAGAVLASLSLLESRTLVIYGDTLFDIDIAHMLEAHENAAADATLLLHPNDHPADSHLVELGADGLVSGFHSPPHPPKADHRNLVNAAFYVIERDAIARWRDSPIPSDFGNDLFPAMLAAGQRLLGYVSAEYIKDLGTPARLDKVERHLSSGLVERSSRRVPQQAVFMDRDGTLNRPAGHISAPDAIELIPGTAAAVRRLNESGLRTILVTNQPVIARGECDLATLERIHGRLELLLSETGGYLDRIYFCPHHPHRGYAGEIPALKIDCDCRKPEVGMIERAISELNIDRHRSWMVGDSPADMLMANRAGLLAARVLTGEPSTTGHQAAEPDIEVGDFAAAVEFITHTYPRLLAAAQPLASSATPGEILLIDGHKEFAAVLRNELRSVGRQAVSLTTASDERTIDDLPPDTVIVVPRATSKPLLRTHRTVRRIAAPPRFSEPST